MAEIEMDDGDEPVIEIGDEIEATEYSIGFSIPDNEVRIQFHNEFGVLSSLVVDAAGAYEFAQRLLRAYDKVEGL
jgi:hypothetical protein